MGDAVERSPLDGALADGGEPALHLVEPRGGGRRAVEVEPGPPGQPCADLGVLVGGADVENQVQVEIGRRLPVDPPQEGEELLVAVALGALPVNRQAIVTPSGV